MLPLFFSYLSLSLVSVVHSVELRGTDFIRDVVEGRGDSRALQQHSPEQCPQGSSFRETFYNVLFDVYAKKEVQCTDEELDIVASILQTEFDDVLLSGSDKLKNGVELLSTETEVCKKYEQAVETVGSEEDANHRRLQVEYHVYLYRAAGTCYYCYPDDLDYRRLAATTTTTAFTNSADENVGDTSSSRSDRPHRELQVNDVLDNAINQVFANLITKLEKKFDKKLTRRLKKSVPDGHCLDRMKPRVKSTVVIQSEEVQKVCEDVYCCAQKTKQDTCFTDWSVFSFCHTTKERCEAKCFGTWINPFNPPQCTSWHNDCQVDQYGGDDCCEGSVCHDYGDANGPRCTPLFDLETEEDGSYCLKEWRYCDVDTGEDPCCDGFYCARGLIHRQCRRGMKGCNNKWNSCTVEDPCCDGLRCNIRDGKTSGYCIQ